MDVQHLVGRQVDYRLHWNQGSDEDKEAEKAIEKLLAEELSVDAAIQISLLNDQRLQATYEELGVTQADVLAQALGITLDWRWIGSADVGFSTERDTDGQWVTGPSLAVEVPIFDQQQTEIARLETQLRQRQKRLAAMAVEIRSEVRALRSRLLIQRDLIEHYQTVMLPLRERIVNLTMKEYNFMLTGVFELLQAKQQEFDDYQNYIEAVRDYWITRARLQQAVGARLQTPGRHSEADRPAGLSNDLSKNLPVPDSDVVSDTALIKRLRNSTKY